MREPVFGIQFQETQDKHTIAEERTVENSIKLMEVGSVRTESTQVKQLGTETTSDHTVDPHKGGGESVSVRRPT